MKYVVLLIAFVSMGAVFASSESKNLPSVKEIQAWNKVVPPLTHTLLKNGWIKKQSFTHLNGSAIYENKKQSVPHVFVLKKVGMLTQKESLETIGKRECGVAQSQTSGAHLTVSFDPKTETYSCWVRRPASLTAQKENNFFFQVRSIAKGSRHYNLFATEVSIDEKSPKPSKIGRKIASELVVAP